MALFEVTLSERLLSRFGAAKLPEMKALRFKTSLTWIGTGEPDFEVRVMTQL
tara:strand:+ start:15587 stop:15742 length:156 start_codon:yes stop_codon:yes gene_type:complete